LSKTSQGLHIILEVLASSLKIEFTSIRREIKIPVLQLQ
jgi:hypothetical protein